MSCTNGHKKAKIGEKKTTSNISIGKLANRSPDYGIVGRDGCIMMEEMEVIIDKTSDSGYIGTVRDVGTGEILKNAKVLIIDMNGNQINSIPGIKGQFSLPSSLITSLRIDCVGYRPFVAQF
jgi:hypothetical protein